jgi:hypothetical protein
VHIADRPGWELVEEHRVTDDHLFGAVAGVDTGDS